MSITQHDTIHYVAFPQNIISKKYTALVMTISHYPQANWKWAFLVWSLVIYFRSLMLVLYFPSNLVAVCNLLRLTSSWKIKVESLCWKVVPISRSYLFFQLTELSNFNCFQLQTFSHYTFWNPFIFSKLTCRILIPNWISVWLQASNLRV